MLKEQTNKLEMHRIILALPRSDDRAGALHLTLTDESNEMSLTADNIHFLAMRDEVCCNFFHYKLV